MTQYPEHEKMAKISDLSQAIGEFLEYQSGRGITLCHRGVYGQRWPVTESLEKMLAKYFEINLDVIEAEKRMMIDEMRRANA